MEQAVACVELPIEQAVGLRGVLSKSGPESKLWTCVGADESRGDRLCAVQERDIGIRVGTVCVRSKSGPENKLWTCVGADGSRGDRLCAVQERDIGMRVSAGPRTSCGLVWG